MREYKFRAWHGGNKDEHGRWVHEPQMLYDEKPGDCLRWKADGQNIVEIMQYAGLKDKNGKEIYKGDVWLYHGVGYLVCWHEDEAKFYFKHPSSHAGDDDHIDLGWSSHGEKIGNIHDNPELLEGTGC